MYIRLLVFVLAATAAAGANTAIAEETARVGKRLMTLANRDGNGLKVVDIACDGVAEVTHCALSGTSLYRSTQRPPGALGDPLATCYLEIGHSELDVQLFGQALVSVDGPGGACETTVTAIINFEARRYSLRKSSAIRTGIFCAAQRNTSTEYDQETATAVHPLSCAHVEVVPSLWFP